MQKLKNQGKKNLPKQTQEETLTSIKSTLEEIKALLLLLNQDKLSALKRELLKEGSVKLQIYELSDGTKTNKDIALAINKDEAYVRSYLAILRREGLIRTDRDTGFHSQVF